MSDLRYPSLYQINTRVWLTELSQVLGRPATLDDIPEAELDRLAKLGFDWVWFLSVWQTGLAAADVEGDLLIAMVFWASENLVFPFTKLSRSVSVTAGECLCQLNNIW